MNPAEEQNGLGTYLSKLNPIGLGRVLYHMRYLLWSVGLAFLIVHFSMGGRWHTMSWASLAFLTLCFYLIFAATPFLQTNPHFMPVITPYPRTLGRDGISKAAAGMGM
jgi:hypothetical protein